MLGHSDREGIADTVYQHSWNSAHMSRDCTQPGLVAKHEERGAGADGQVDRPAWRDDASILDRVRREREQVDGALLDRALLVEAGQHQHVLDKPAHPGRLLLDPLHDPVHVGPGEVTGQARRGGRDRPAAGGAGSGRPGRRGVGGAGSGGPGRRGVGGAGSGGPGRRGVGRRTGARRLAVWLGRRTGVRRLAVWLGRREGAVVQPAALPVVLGVAADRGERGAQLVAGIGQEAAQPFLGLPCGGLGPGPRPEGRFDLGQHHV